MAFKQETRVLIVDDIEENLKVLSETLTENGLYPLQARSGDRAVQIAVKAQPDLILLDINMPGMNGFETIAELKAREETRDIPVIFISALNDIEDKIRGFKAGAVDYVSKPFREEEVIARVTTHLQLQHALKEVERQGQITEKLLLNVLPAEVARELKETGAVEPQNFPDVSILFSDFVGFTDIASKLSPRQLIDELNEMYTVFDSIMEENGCERIKTIGDAYLAVCGMHPAREDHANRLIKAAKQMLEYISERRKAEGALPWEIRIGINSGDVTGGVVGTRKYIYDIFGDAMNIASRMEANSEPGRLNVSECTYKLAAEEFSWESRDPAEVKGLGSMQMFFLTN